MTWTSNTTAILLLLAAGLVGRSHYIAGGAALLLLLHLTKLEGLFPIIERRGLDFGLLFLVLAVLTPFATGKVEIRELTFSLKSLPGLMAIIGGALATHLNGRGIELLKTEPEVMAGLIIGNIIGVLFLRGVPVGPLAAGGIAALLIELLRRVGARY
ncbi:MAG: DUF441 domain-containing protein [Firmicutes bacterium]|nr:DUF441 domain-containing protein [Bacillota bacterium]MCL5039197.1 DUF441 domain-containing protein [Bacillota bacterium]